MWVTSQDLGANGEPRDGLPGTFRPFDLHATDAVEFGEENWVVVRITNK